MDKADIAERITYRERPTTPRILEYSHGHSIDTEVFLPFIRNTTVVHDRTKLISMLALLAR